MKDSYAAIKNQELFVYNLHISPFEKGNIFNKDPLRTRKLLVHKQEILKLIRFNKAKRRYFSTYFYVLGQKSYKA